MFSGGEFAYYYVFLPLRFSLSLSLPTGNNNNNNHNNNNLVERERKKGKENTVHDFIYIYTRPWCWTNKCWKDNPPSLPFTCSSLFPYFFSKKSLFFFLLILRPSPISFHKFFFSFLLLCLCRVVLLCFSCIHTWAKPKKRKKWGVNKCMFLLYRDAHIRVGCSYNPFYFFNISFHSSPLFHFFGYCGGGDHIHLFDYWGG